MYYNFSTNNNSPTPITNFHSNISFNLSINRFSSTIYPHWSIMSRPEKNSLLLPQLDIMENGSVQVNIDINISNMTNCICLGAGNYVVDDIDASLCTHYIYGFATLDASTYTMVPFDPDTDVGSKNFYEQFVNLRIKYPNKKFLIAIGGWVDSRTSKYSTLLASATRRANFVTKAVEFIKKYRFDGLDLDYEYPAYEQSATEKTTFALWVKELKAAFEPYGWELTAAVAAGKSTIDAGYDVPEISKYLDAIHLMTYDLHGSWESVIDHHATLYGKTIADTLTVDYA